MCFRIQNAFAKLNPSSLAMYYHEIWGSESTSSFTRAAVSSIDTRNALNLPLLSFNGRVTVGEMSCPSVNGCKRWRRGRTSSHQVTVNVCRRFAESQSDFHEVLLSKAILFCLDFGQCRFQGLNKWLLCHQFFVHRLDFLGIMS